MNPDRGERFTTGLCFGVGLLLGLLLLFPTDRVQSVIHTRIQKHLPAFMTLDRVRFQGFRTLSARVQVNHPRGPLPVRVHLRPEFSWQGLPVRITVPGVDALVGRYQPQNGRLRVSAREVPLSELLPQQVGTLSGSLVMEDARSRSGQFELEFKTGSLRASEVVPQALANYDLRRVEVRGTFRHNLVQLEDFRVEAGSLRARGSGKLRLVRPLRRSELQLHMQLRSPVRRTLNRTVQLGNLSGLLRMGSRSSPGA